jgi:uncharacterized repeat protein (TIGR01451 family)
VKNFTFLRQFLIAFTLISTVFFTPLFSNAQIRPFSLAYSNNLHGGHTLIGNSLVAIKNAAGTDDLTKMNDFGSYANDVTSQYINDGSNVGYVDVDGVASAPVTIIAPGSAWSYSNAASQPAGWPIVSAVLPGGPGAGPLAYGPTGAVGTTLPDIRTYYFAKTVTINPALSSSFTFNLTIDDGAVVYVNGVEVARFNMPAGAVSFTTNASSNLEPEQAYSVTVGTGAPFINGSNSVTVELHTSADNESGTDDAFFDLELKGNGLNPTANSSSADLVLPSGANTIPFARLYFGGIAAIGSGGLNNILHRTVQIKFGSAASYTTLVAPVAQIDTIPVSATHTAYQAYVDVSAYVAANGAGTYTVAGVNAATGNAISGGAFAGWGMAVVYENPALPFSSVRAYDGYLQVYSGGSATTLGTTLTGFNVPATLLAPGDAIMTAMSFEGDANLAKTASAPNGDFIEVNGIKVFNAANPVGNIFNGTISKKGLHVTTKSPNFKNNFLDIDEVEVGVGYGIAANATTVNLLFGTEADRYFPSVFAFTLASKDPTVTLDKAVSDALPPFNTLQLNEVITYTLSGTNTGVGPAFNCTVIDTIPAGVTYVPNSLEVISGLASVGVKTDASDADEAFKATAFSGRDYVKFYIGTGATNLSGGVLQPAEAYQVRFKAVAPAVAADLITVVNTGLVTSNALSGEQFTDEGTATIPPGSGPLAVKLSAFNVSKENSNAVLRWVTQSEVKNDAFVIERGFDGINFSKIGNVKGNGTTSNISNYQFADPLSGLSAKIVYYRLRIVDIDGKSGYSKIIALRLDGSVAINNLSVYPNPFTNNIKLRINGTKEESLIVRISSMSGQMVVKRSINIQPGENIVVLQDLESLTQGAHLLEIITSDGTITQKIMKNK